VEGKTKYVQVNVSHIKRNKKTRKIGTEMGKRTKIINIKNKRGKTDNNKRSKTR